MKRKLYTILYMMMLAMLAQSIATPVLAQGDLTWTGTGEADNPYEISSAEHLAAIATKGLDKHYKLTGDITVDNWDIDKSIGTSDTPFTGTFDGQGYVITITGSASLFGQVGKSGETAGTVKNLGMDAKIDGYTDCIGAIAGSSYGTIQYCFVEGSITSSKDYLGGIIGKNVGTIEDCYTTVSIKATGVVKRVGGIAGFNDKSNSNAGTIQRCYATGAINNINTNFNAGAGGIVGQNSINAGTTIKNCIALNESITGNTTGRIIVSNYGGNDALTDNYASPLIPGTWAEKEAGKKNGADLTEGNFITNATAEGGAFYGWNNGNTAWDFTTPANLPTLTGFKDDQPVKDITRESTITKLLITEIKNADDLATFRDAVNSGETYEGKIVTLANDITVTGWEVGIGIEADKKPFSGTFDGQGHVINLTGSTSLFVLIGKANETYGTVKNLGVNAEITANTTNIGGIVGHNYGTIQNCYTKGTITNDSYYTGGIAGDNGGTIQNCYSTALCTGNNVTGGIVGKHSGTILQCYATGAIAGEKAGGIAGTFSGSIIIQNCIALNASISGTTKGRIIGSINTPSGLANNHASPLLPGTAAEMEASKKDGANLTKDNFINVTTATGAFTDWPTGNDGWGLTTTSLPTLEVFKDENNPQPAKGITRVDKLLIFKIASADDLAIFRTVVAGGATYQDKTVTLTKGITVGDWKTGIGTDSKPFLGTFDGAGHVINLTGSASLFTILSNSDNTKGTIQNLGVKVKIEATDDITDFINIAGIAVHNHGTIKQCYTTGEISGDYAGGIVVQNHKLIQDCYSTASVTANYGAGGIAQNNYSEDAVIERCFATGAITSKDEESGGIAGVNNGSITKCIALNTSIKEVDNSNRIAGEKGTTLADNFASPLIPGEWSSKEGNDLDGADLTDDTFIDKGANEGAFTGWQATAWDFGDKSQLPKLKTTGLSPDIVITGQGDDSGNMPTRADFLESVIEISTPVTYNATTHNGKPIRVLNNGIFTVNADGASFKKLTIEEGGQVVAQKAFKCEQLLAPRTLNNKWTAYGSPVEMKAVTKANQTFHRLIGYTSTNTISQVWGNSGSSPSPVTSFDISDRYLIATDEDNVPVTLTAPMSDSYVNIPADATPKTGEALANGIFMFYQNPTLKNVTLKVAYILSTDGTRFERTENAPVKPFQSYIVANTATTDALKSLRVGEMPTANEQIVNSDFRIWGANGQLHLSAERASRISIYTPSGQLLRTFTLTGEQTVTLGSGIYFVHSNNITYKVSL